MAKNPAYRRSVRVESVKYWNNPTLSEQLAVAEAGQLWGVTASELSISADYRTRKICLLKEDG